MRLFFLQNLPLSFCFGLCFLANVPVLEPFCECQKIFRSSLKKRIREFLGDFFREEKSLTKKKVVFSESFYYYYLEKALRHGEESWSETNLVKVPLQSLILQNFSEKKKSIDKTKDFVLKNQTTPPKIQRRSEPEKFFLFLFLLWFFLSLWFFFSQVVNG